jgi:AcrR family transcriptional regulator
MCAHSSSLTLRNTPSQVRSAMTVEAIFQATIQVLLTRGLKRLTTTRVAERAGVSVGTLYQYFPNKDVLLAGLLRRHLLDVVEQVEGACGRNQGQSLSVMVGAIVDSYVSSKTQVRDISRALYGVATEQECAPVVTEMASRMQAALINMFATAHGGQIWELPTVAGVCFSAMAGPVQRLIESQATEAEVSAVRVHLKRMILAYLRAAAESNHRETNAVPDIAASVQLSA